MSDEPLEKTSGAPSKKQFDADLADDGNSPLDLDNFHFQLGDFTFDMDHGTLFTTWHGVRTEHYAFEYTGPPLYALARAWAEAIQLAEAKAWSQLVNLVEPPSPC